MKHTLPLAAMERLMRLAGAERVSEPAKKALREVLEEHGHKISVSAIELSKHAKRKTIKAEDIKLASK
jgi:histone H3/H4